MCWKSHFLFGTITIKLSDSDLINKSGHWSHKCTHARKHAHTYTHSGIIGWQRLLNGSSCAVTDLLWSFYLPVKVRRHLKWQLDVHSLHLSSAVIRRCCLPSLVDVPRAERSPSSSITVTASLRFGQCNTEILIVLINSPPGRNE